MTPFEGRNYAAWQFVKGEKVLLFFVRLEAVPNQPNIVIRLRGLKEEGLYIRDDTEQVLSGAALMRAGVLMPHLTGDYQAKLFYFKQICR